MRKTKLNNSYFDNRILIIDDEIGIVNSVSVILKRNGYDCAGVTDPLEGIKLLKEQHFDILILDYLMENIHGDEVIKMVRGFNSDLYIILLTGHKDIAPPLLTIKAFEIQAYCEKSDRFDQLTLLVESARKSVIQMKTIRRFNDSLNAIIKSMSNIYRIKPLEAIVNEILLEIQSIIECENGFILVYENSSIRILPHNIFKGIGIYNKELDKFMIEDYPSLKNQLNNARTGNDIVRIENGIILPLVNEYFNSQGVLYLQGESFNDCEKILEIFWGQVNAALSNSIMHLLVNAKNEELSKAYDEIDNLFKVLEGNYRHQVDKNEFLEQVVKSRTAAIRSLLDNAGQGFLSFGPDLVIDSEYSLECTRIFGNNIENNRFSTLLFPEDEDSIKLIDEAFINIFKEKDISKREAYISLIPDEVEMGGRYIHLEYKTISSNANENLKKVMVVLTDYTEKRHLESQMEEERRVLKMVVNVVTNKDDFFDCIDQYNRFSERKDWDILKINKPFEYIVLELYRQIHTFKGSFANFQLTNAVSDLQDFEDKMFEFKKNIDKRTKFDLQELLNGFDLKIALDKDLKVLENVLGKEFFKCKGKVHIDKQKLIEIENKMEAMLSKEECEVLVPLVRKLRLRPFSDLIRTYPEYVLRMTEMYGKRVYPFNVESDTQILVDADIFGDFARALIHIFRNIIDHAIEYPEDRLEAGKDVSATVKCSIKLVGDSMVITVSDDGQGIDINEIRNWAVKNDVYSIEKVNKFSDKEVVDLIFWMK